MRLQISPTAANDRGPRYAEQFFQILHQGNRKGLPVTLLIETQGGEASLFIEGPKSLERFITTQLQAHYPDVVTTSVAPKKTPTAAGYKRLSLTLTLTPDLFPLRTHPDFSKDEKPAEYSDPIAGVLAAVSAGQEYLHPQIRYCIRPTTGIERYRAQRILQRLANPLFHRHPRLLDWYAARANSPDPRKRLLALLVTAWQPNRGSRVHSEALTLAQKKISQHTFRVALTVSVTAHPKHLAEAHARLQELAGSLGQFTGPGASVFVAKHASSPQLNERRGFLLSDQELATVFHPSTHRVRVAKTTAAQSRQLEPPLWLPSAAEADAVTVGRANFPRRREAFGLLTADRLQHLYIVGATGEGKSTLIKHMIRDDLYKGRGLAVIDPHGNLAREVEALVPAKRRREVVTFAPGDVHNQDAFNPFYLPAEASDFQKEWRANVLLSAFMRVFQLEIASAPRLQYVLRNAVLALLDTKNATLLDLMEMLRNDHRRQEIVSQIRNIGVRKFWEEEFDVRGKAARNEWVAPIQNKVGTFTTSPTLRRVFGAKRSSFDLHSIMDSGKIFIVNLDKGILTEEVSSIFGIMLMAYFHATVMGRSNLKPFFLFVDEFQNFASEMFESLFSESRKRGLGMTIAHQYLGQLDNHRSGFSLRGPVFGNVGSMVSFRVGADDAEALAQAFGGDVAPDDLTALAKFHAYTKLMINGSPCGPFSIKLLPPTFAPRHQRRVRRRKTRQSA